MKPILKQTEAEVGIIEKKFYKFQGQVPADMFNFIDRINAALDLPQLEESQVMLLAKFIIYEFSTLTMQDIEQAIFKAKAGKLDCNPADYNKLSIDFIGRILSSYTEYKRKQTLVKQAKEVEAKEHLKLEYTVNEGKQSFDFIKSVYEKGEEPYIADWCSAFRYMEDEGLINLTNDEKAMFLDLVIEELNEEIKKMKVQRKNPNHLKNLLASKEKIKNECRKRLVIKYFEK
jgi:hypothetical protein